MVAAVDEAEAETGPTADDQPTDDEGAPASHKTSETAAVELPATIASAGSIATRHDITRPASSARDGEDARSGMSNTDAETEENQVDIVVSLI